MQKFAASRLNSLANRLQDLALHLTCMATVMQTQMLTLTLLCLTTSLLLVAQQTPKWTLELTPGFAGGNTRVSDDPDDDLTYFVLAPELGYTRTVFKSFALEAQGRYIRTYGDIESYESTSLTLGVRNYLIFGNPSKERERLATIARKRFSLYPFLRYSLQLSSRNPENNRFKELESGFSAGIGSSLFFTRNIGFTSELKIHETGPFYSNNVAVSWTSHFTFTKLTHWPETKHLAGAHKRAPVAEGSPRYLKPRQAVFVEAGIGYAPQEEENPNGEGFINEHPVYYTIAGGLLLPHNFEVGVTASVLDAIGSISDEVDIQRRDQYYFAGVFTRYDIPVYTNRIRLLAELSYSHSNYTYFNDAGHRRLSRSYFGFAPIVRYAIQPRIYVSGSMRFNTSLDGDRNTLAANFPELRFTLLGKDRSR